MCGREVPSLKQPYKVQYLHFWYLKTFGDPVKQSTGLQNLSKGLLLGVEIEKFHQKFRPAIWNVSFLKANQTDDFHHRELAMDFPFSPHKVETQFPNIQWMKHPQSQCQTSSIKCAWIRRKWAILQQTSTEKGKHVVNQWISNGDSMSFHSIPIPLF